MISSLDAEKAFDKIQHPFMIKVLERSGITGTYLNMIKSNIQQTNSQHQTKWRETQGDSSKIKNKTRLSIPYLFNIVLEVLARAIRQQKEIKAIQIRKEEVKLSLFADDMIVYINDLKKTTRELLQLINTFSKVAGYKFNSKRTSSSTIYRR